MRSKINLEKQIKTKYSFKNLFCITICSLILSYSTTLPVFLLKDNGPPQYYSVIIAFFIIFIPVSIFLKKTYTHLFPKVTENNILTGFIFLFIVSISHLLYFILLRTPQFIEELYQSHELQVNLLQNGLFSMAVLWLLFSIFLLLFSKRSSLSDYVKMIVLNFAALAVCQAIFWLFGIIYMVVTWS